MSLVRLPEHQFLESPASWFTRAALSQFSTTNDLRTHCEIGTEGDLDLSFGKKSFGAVAASLGAVSDSFAAVDHILGNLRLVDPLGWHYMLGIGKVARYRYCPVCLAGDKVKYFRLEWRFRCWLWCPLHKCRMCDACPSCSKPIHLPADLISAGPAGWGVATLDRCLACEALLTEDADTATNTLDFFMLSEWERCLLGNGRAVLAALLHGRYTLRTEQSSIRKPVNTLNRLEKLGLIPHFSDIPDWVRQSGLEG